MSAFDEQVTKELRVVRHELALLQPDDKDSLIRIGSELERVVNLVPEGDTLIRESIMDCLGGLQAIYAGSVASFEGLVSTMIAALASVEHLMSAHNNPIAVEMLVHSMSLVESKLRPSDDVVTNDVETISAPELGTLDQIAAFLASADKADATHLEVVGEALKHYSDAEASSEIRKLVVKAARQVGKALKQPKGDLSKIYSSVASLVDQANGMKVSDPLEASKAGPEADLQLDIVEELPQPIAEIVAPAEPELTVASAEVGPEEKPDVLPADVDLELIAEFITESSEMLEEAEAALLDLETDLGNLEHVNTIFRAFHTIKGSAGYFGLSKLSMVAHKAESLLSRMRDREIECAGSYADLALRSVDALNNMLVGVQNAVDGGVLVTPDDFEELIQHLSNPEMEVAATSSSPLMVEALMPDMHGLSASEIRETRLGEILIQLGRVTAEQLRTIEFEVNTKIGTLLVRKGLITSRDVDEALAVQSRLRAERRENREDTSVRVRTERLDQILDMVGELVIAHSMLEQESTALQSTHHELVRRITHAGKIVRELQDVSMGVRMIPLKPTFQKMTRLIRDLANKCSKKVEFVTEGEDTEIDRNMVAVIADPLVHMVRNAVDHGIEPPDVRASLGKPETGQVRLSAYYSCGNIVVQLSDDGRGLDAEKIAAKAIKQGLIETDRGMTEREIFQLIFAPGFSMAKEVTDVSGRGVGMDVVRKNIETLRGRVEIKSTPGKGTTFTIDLPLTLAITDGMLIRVGSERFIIPIANIHLTFRPERSMLSRVQGRGEMVNLRNELMPLFRLHELFNVTGAIENSEEGLLMVVADGTRRCALLVDELLGQHQVVAKNIGKGIGRVPGVSGGAILGDGCVGLILDIPEIVTAARETDSTVAPSHVARQVGVFSNVMETAI